MNASLPILMLCFLACKNRDNGENDAGACERTLPSWTESSESDDDGIVEIEVEANGNLRSVLLTVNAEEDDTLLYLAEIEDPEGDLRFDSTEWWSSNEILTMAYYPYHPTSTVNWPILPEGQFMSDGTWTFRFRTIRDWNYSSSGQEPVDVTVHENHNSIDEGCLHVRFVLAEGIPDNESLMSDIETAAAVFEGIMIRHDIQVHSSWLESDLDPVLPSPGAGDTSIEALTNDGPEDTLNIIIGETVEIETEGVAGESGGIPGSLRATPHSAVIVAWLELAGISGSLDDSEVQMLGETIAHEAGHYLGLVHPVQFDEDLDIVAWDALDDTRNCNDVDTCLEELSSNVMFPYLLCDWTNYCDAQDELTDHQGQVLRNYTGVR